MFTITKTFLRWYYPKLAMAEELLGQLGRLAPIQLESEQWLRRPMKLGEARHVRVDALRRYFEDKLEEDGLQIRHDPTKQTLSLRLLGRYGQSSFVPLPLPRSITDYLACQAPAQIRPELNRVHTSAVLVLAKVEGITPAELLTKALYEYLVMHGCSLMSRLSDDQGGDSELAQELRELGLHPHEFVTTFHGFASSFVAGRGVAV